MDNKTKEVIWAEEKGWPLNLFQSPLVLSSPWWTFKFMCSYSPLEDDGVCCSRAELRTSGIGASAVQIKEDQFSVGRVGSCKCVNVVKGTKQL